MDGTMMAPPNDDRGKGLLAEEVSLTTIALLTTIVRVGIRLYNRQAKWDDLAITIAMAFRLVSFAFTMVSIHYGNGRHVYYLTEHQIQEVIKWTWGNEVLIFTTVCIIKISICLHIFRIKNNGWLKWLLNITMVGLVITNGACIIILLAQCHPLSAFWRDELDKCWDQNIYNDFIYVSVGYSIVSDLLCTAMPIVILWNVRITRAQKLAICGLMFLGLIASACAAVRAYLSSLQEGTDLTYELVTTDEWAFAEANVGIIAANLALGQMMYVFWKKHCGRKTPPARKPAALDSLWQRPRMSHRRSESTLCESDDLTPTKESETASTENTDTTATTPSSQDSTFPRPNSNAPGTITRTIEFTVAANAIPPGSPVLNNGTLSWDGRPVSSSAFVSGPDGTQTS